MLSPRPLLPFPLLSHNQHLLLQNFDPAIIKVSFQIQSFCYLEFNIFVEIYFRFCIIKIFYATSDPACNFIKSISNPKVKVFLCNCILYLKCNVSFIMLIVCIKENNFFKLVLSCFSIIWWGNQALMIEFPLRKIMRGLRKSVWNPQMRALKANCLSPTFLSFKSFDWAKKLKF